MENQKINIKTEKGIVSYDLADVQETIYDIYATIVDIRAFPELSNGDKKAMETLKKLKDILESGTAETGKEKVMVAFDRFYRYYDLDCVQEVLQIIWHEVNSSRDSKDPDMVDYWCHLYALLPA